MDRNWLIRFSIVALVTLAAVWILAPTVVYFRLPPDKRNDVEAFEEALPGWLPKKHLNLGLDLQGGIHLVLRVEVEKAVMNQASRRAEEVVAYAKEKGIEGIEARPDRRRPVVHVKVPAEAREKFDGVVLEFFNDMHLVSEADGELTLAYKTEEIDRIREQAVEQAVKTIRNRVDAWGVSEPQIVKRGEDQVLVQLPGVKDPDRAKSLLGKTAQLQFHIVEDHLTSFLKEHEDLLPEGVKLLSEQGQGPDGPVQAYYLVASDRTLLEKAREVLLPYMPDGVILAFEKQGGNKPGQEVTYRTWVLAQAPGVTGEKLTNARVAFDQQRGGRPYVLIDFDRQGAVEFEKLTEANVGRRMAIVLDDTVMSAPVIQEKIPGGTARITMGGLKSHAEVAQEAKDLALVLRAGALPAPVRVLEERSVGASLGPDLIRRGLTALAIGGLAVLLLMILWYRLSGVVADLSLLLNVVCLLAILSLFGATLTLPGIAGIVLTVGMAVDANVIIFERIREELDVGKTARAAIDQGYSKAFSAILDGNITTGIAAFVLLQYGTGPIRGFAVTLLAGIATTLFCGVFVSRVLTELLNSGRSGKVSI